MTAKRYRRMTFAEKQEYSRRDELRKDRSQWLAKGGVTKRQRFRCMKCQTEVEDRDAPSHLGRCWVEAVMALFTKVS